MKKFYSFIAILITINTYAQNDWVIISDLPDASNYDVKGIEIIDENTLFVASTYYSSTFRGNIHYSNNAGQTWTELYDSGSGYGGSTSMTFKIEFIDENNGFFLLSTSSNKILGKTTDGGSNWSVNPINFCGSCGNKAYDLYFQDVNNGVMSTNTGVMSTTNGGTSWNSTSSIIPINMKINKTTGIGFAIKSGESYRTVSTTNHGLTWNNYTTMPLNGAENRYVSSVDQTGAFVGIWDFGDDGYPTGREGGIYRATSQGGTPQRLYQNAQEFTGIGVLDDNIMFVYDTNDDKIYEVSNYMSVNPEPSFNENSTVAERINFVLKDQYGYAYTANKKMYKFNNANLSVNNNTTTEKNFSIISNSDNSYTVSTISSYIGIVNMSIYDINGRLISNHTNKKERENWTINLNEINLSNGVYILKTVFGNKIITRKIIK